MDQAIRSKLRSVVTQCRRLLEESVARQLQGKYDIYATGKKDEVRAEKDVPLGHLSDEEQVARQDILAHFEHVEALGYKPRESLEQLIREIAFTHLNRLCAYKMMEVRDVYVGGQKFREAVSKGLKSQGFLFYLAEHPEDEKRYNVGDQENAYRHFLNWLGGTLSQEIGVLFSPTDPANRVYPTQRVLDEVLDLLNSEELKRIWSEDETIGWVYQYFTPKEQRDEARKASQAPRNSYELAFRNQFFTPRYVVEFLTDNTLGRIWYEMRRGNTRLKDECRYMVRRPGEVFFTEKEGEPGSPVRAMRDLLLDGTEETFPPFRTGETQLLVELAHTVDGYERHPFEDQVEGEWWPWAKLREIREAGDLSRFPAQDLLDVLFCQARADRHGGGYGDWDEIFYDIANEVRRRAIEGRKEDASQEQLLRAITAIVHRAKKDPREIKTLDPACGSGHFLLYCFALLLVIYDEAYDDPELRPGLQGDYPTKDDLRRAVPGLILRHNLHGIDIDLRCTQIAALALWLRCQRAYQEMGFKKDRPRITKSNIVCAEPMPGEGHMLKEFVAQIEPKLLGQLVEVVFDKMKLAGEAGSLLKIEEEIRDAVAEARRQWRIGPVTTQMRLFGDPKPVVRQQQFDLSGITDSQFFEQAEEKLVDALRHYAEQAQNGERLQRRLFSEDAVRGFAFVDICHKRFDVALMNPPFGKASPDADEYLRDIYPDNWKDLYAAFLERCITHFAADGSTGGITSSLFMYTKQLRALRAMWVGNKSLLCLIELGAEVLDTAAVETALTVTTSQPIELTLFSDLTGITDKGSELGLVDQLPPERYVFHRLSRFRNLFAYPFCYHMADKKLALWSRPDRLDPDHATVALGNHTFDDERFLRLRWEVPAGTINHKWFGYEKGGEYQPYFCSTPLLLNWENDGQELRQFEEDRHGTDAQVIQSRSLWWRAGITYPRVSSVGFGPRAMPAGHIFGSESISIFPSDTSDTLPLLGFLCSSWAEDLIEAFGRYRKIENRAVSNIPLQREEFARFKGELSRHAMNGVRLVLQIESWGETSAVFGVPQGFPSIGSGCSGQQRDEWGTVKSEMERLAQETDICVSQMLFGGAAPALAAAPRQELLRRVFRAAEHLPSDKVKDRLSYCIGSVFGRWDIRFPSVTVQLPDLPDPFRALSVCAPGALQGEDGLPPSTSPADYPLRIDWDGILVDAPDPPDDIIRRVRDVLELIWKDRADATEREVCVILGVTDLRDYFRKPGAGGFWDDHIKRYSKSRRKAPIYWLLQSSKKNYALWIYYHRLDKDILFKALLNYVEPKIRREESRLDELRSQKSALEPAAKGAKKFDKDIDRQEAFIAELQDFEGKLRRAANLHLDPDLNDGVVLNIAPLRELVPWKEAKSYWNDLMDGKYEWSSIGKQLREKGLVK